MHRQIAADAVAGAVLEIDAGLPQELPRQRIELRAGGAVGKHRARDRDMAAQHAGEAVAHFRRWFADRDGAGDVGGAVLILRAGIDQQEIAGRDPPVGLAGDAVMHDGAVRSGAGDGRKRNVLQRAGVAAEGFQRFHGVDLGQMARGRLAVDPGEEARQRHRVAAVRVAGALDLDRVLAGLEQRHGIAAAHHLAAGAFDQAAQRVGGSGAVERDRRAALRQRGKFARQRVRFGDVGGLLEMIARAVGELAVIDEYGWPAVLRHQRIGQRQRRMRDVGAADVEGPGHRMGIRQHQRVDAEPFDLAADALELVALGFAGKLRAVNGDRAERRLWAFGPYGIDGVGVDRDEFRLGLGAGGGQPFGCRRGVQPWIESEAISGRKMCRQPAFGGGVDQRLDPPSLGIDLFCGLQRVAAVDEHGGFMRQHDGKPRRSGKAGEPRQPLFRRRHIFVLLLVGRGITNPVSFRRASSSRNAESRAVSATPLSGSSNVWKWASNMGGTGRMGAEMTGTSVQCGNDCCNLAWLVLQSFRPALDRRKRFCMASRSLKISEDVRECLNSTRRGYTMPVFSFEKISPPSPRAPVVAAAVRRQPGFIVQMLVRFVGIRARRASRNDRAGSELKRK